MQTTKKLPFTNIAEKVKTSLATKQTTLTGVARQLYDKLESKTATIGVIGLGYVGLPLSIEYAKKGFKTIGVDSSSKKVNQLNAGQSYIQDVDNTDLKIVIGNKNFRAVKKLSPSEPESIDVFFICVPTPVTEHKEPDMAHIEKASRVLAKQIRVGQLFILKSTTYPDTTEGLIMPILAKAAKKKGLELGQSFFLAFSPERVDPGNDHQYTTATTPVVVGGVSPACTELASKAIFQVLDVNEGIHPVSSPKVAEMEKLLENIFRSVNIALVNELASLCDRMGDISIWEVVEAAATKPFGFMKFSPGPGIGGHCIPVDPYYLSWFSRKYDFETSFITLAARINEEMPYKVVNAIVHQTAKQNISHSIANILILGVAFKKNVDDIRHSPALKIIELLKKKGFNNIRYSDPYVPSLSPENSNLNLRLSSVKVDTETLHSVDVSVICTDHDKFEYPLIAKQSKMIVDTRNALKNIPHDPKKVCLLGGGKF
jgi:UDP-N-acetyl-D-glucosamine dehydrogenase